MRYKNLIASTAMVLLISVTNSGNLMAHDGGMGGSFHGGMSGGFSSGMHSFGMSGFGGGMHSFSYSPQHFNAAPRINGNFVSRMPSNSFNNSFHAQQFNFRNNGNFQSTIQHPVNPQAWSHNNNWWRNNYAWNRGYDHDHDFDHFRSFAFFPYWSPFWDYGPFYSWYGYPYNSYYDYGYSPYDYYGYYEPSGYYSDTSAVESAYSPVTEQYSASSGENIAASNDWGDQFLNSARDAFRNGDYSDALRLGSHAAVESPKDAKAHELMSLALFALKDYKGANI